MSTIVTHRMRWRRTASSKSPKRSAFFWGFTEDGSWFARVGFVLLGGLGALRLASEVDSAVD